MCNSLFFQPALRWDRWVSPQRCITVMQTRSMFWAHQTLQPKRLMWDRYLVTHVSNPYWLLPTEINLKPSRISKIGTWNSLKLHCEFQLDMFQYPTEKRSSCSYGVETAVLRIRMTEWSLIAVNKFVFCPKVRIKF